ncbi:MAG: TetR/AcrR family transcriptional regulator [Proteobacteria bacterium]|nr:TetR/AcrR family transcriptional regulator [Pseudomonadota bacterium]
MSEKATKAKQNYHHGNLRDSLIEQATSLLEQEGLTALSLRRVAKEAGVSQAAPYSHFKNKRALLTAVARQGYLRFTEQMRREAETHDIDLVGLGIGYVNFALKNPALFHLMFNSNLTEMINPDEIDEAFSSGYLLLSQAIEREPLVFPGEDGRELDAAFSWSLVHGIANLIMANKLFQETYTITDRRAFIEKLLIRYLGFGEDKRLKPEQLPLE